MRIAFLQFPNAQVSLSPILIDQLNVAKTAAIVSSIYDFEVILARGLAVFQKATCRLADIPVPKMDCERAGAGTLASVHDLASQEWRDVVTVQA